MMDNSLESISTRLAQIVLDIGSVRLSPNEPFTWASGYKMPVYNDNRLLLGKAEYRFLVAQGFQTIINQKNIPVDVVAGTATAGIAPATTLANLLEKPLIYVRPKPKDHGMKNLVEGPLRSGEKVLIIEDLISTGGSALNAVDAVRKSGASSDHCLCIFTYSFQTAYSAFEAQKCQLSSLLTFPFLIEFAEENKTISQGDKVLLETWYQSPFEWGEKHGFPKKK